MTTPLAIDFLVLQCAELQQLQLDAMSEPTTPTLPTSPSLSRKTWQNNLTNKAHVAETSLAISDGLWRSLTISWDVFGRMVPLRSVAPPLGASPSRGIRPSRLEHSWMRIFANVNAATCCDQPSHLQPPLSMFANMK